MFLLDDVLLAPGKAAYVLFQELARKAQEEWLNDDVVKQELQQLYAMLEGGRISEKDFEAQECRLLERLEQIARMKYQDKWGETAPDLPAPQELAAPAVHSGASMSALETVPPLLPAFDTPRALPPPAAPPPPPVAPPPPPVAAPPAPVAAAVSPPPPPTPVAVVSPPPIALSAPPQYAVTPPPPVAYAPPPPITAPAVMAPPPAPAPGAPLSIGQVIDCAVRALAVLKMRVSSITSVMPDDQQWRVAIELVERRGIPDTNDVLGLYEVRLDHAGNVLRYERTLMRRRCDFAR